MVKHITTTPTVSRVCVRKAIGNSQRSKMSSPMRLHPSATETPKKKSWSEQEDQQLVRLVAKYGPQRWSIIAKHVSGRAGKQCRQRWYNHLCPDICKGEWSPSEEWVLFLAHTVLGNKWALITHEIPGRTDNTIKNHWNSSMKKKIQSLTERLEKVLVEGGLYCKQEEIKLTEAENKFINCLHRRNRLASSQQPLTESHEANRRVETVAKSFRRCEPSPQVCHSSADSAQEPQYQTPVKLQLPMEEKQNIDKGMSEIGSTGLFFDESTKLEGSESPVQLMAPRTPIKRNIIIVRSPRVQF